MAVTGIRKYNFLLQSILITIGWAAIIFFLSNGWQKSDRFFLRMIPVVIGVTFILFVNVKLLLPKLYFQKKYILYIIASATLILLTAYVLYESPFLWSDWFVDRPRPNTGQAFNNNPPVPNDGIRWIGRITPFLIAFLANTLLEISHFASIKEKQVIRSEKEKLETELKFLKSQINPHFLFNALNNLYSQAVMQAPQTPDTVMQLSEILRYMVYDSNELQVPIKSEVNYIENYIRLMSLKDSKGLNINFETNCADKDILVAPLLFSPLVENAFKHSKIEDRKDGFIDISLNADEKAISFNVTNSIPQINFTKDKVGGVGLENVKKRLVLLYPKDQHMLMIKNSDVEFEVQLKIQLL